MLAVVSEQDPHKNLIGVTLAWDPYKTNTKTKLDLN